ncbi:hypothetical protein [Streptomyces sp. RPT161]|uniref:hypothetical protein n=1 Tax=Streptomyces sp. RPT161 TaxID=3015993 RepID=UPI0022B86D02|nr:hypothetical protein [Streptomyces sp. RPT161]
MNESDYADYPADAPDQREDVETVATEPEVPITRATRTWVVSRAGIAEARADGGRSKPEGQGTSAPA